jgi:hypothetical protein
VLASVGVFFLVVAREDFFNGRKWLRIGNMEKRPFEEIPGDVGSWNI